MQRFLLIMMLLLIMPIHTQAALITWTDPTPNALAPFKNNSQSVAQLAGNDLLLYSHPARYIEFNTPSGIKKYQNAQFSSIAMVVNATPDQIAQTLKNYQGYVGLFPTLKKAQILETQNQVSQVKYSISIPTPIKVLNFNDDVIMQHRFTQNSITTLIIDAPLPYGVGKFEWFALDAKRSLLTLTHWSDVNNSKGFLVSTLLKAMPEIKDSLPYSANTFAMESLNLKFNGKTAAKKFPVGSLPNKSLTLTQYQQVIAISQQSTQPVTFIHPNAAIAYQHGYENLRFSTSYQYFKSKPQQVAQLLQPQVWSKLFPKQVKSVSLIANQDKSNDALIHIRAGLGVITIPFDLRLRYTTIADKNPTFQRNDISAVGGDIKFLRSRTLIQPYAQGTIWQITAAAKIDDQAPFLLRAAKSLPYSDVLPSATLARVISSNVRKQLHLD